MQRRKFIFWLPVAIISSVSLTANLLNKFLLFILGPKLTPKQELKQIKDKVATLESNVKLEKLREERLSNNKIFVCKLSDLKQEEGIPLVDFQMKPGLAFQNDNGKPILISGVCTHLGCTVLGKLSRGKLLCPCHNAYFELETGKPVAGPAKTPLPMIPYIVEDEKVYLVKVKNA